MAKSRKQVKVVVKPRPAKKKPVTQQEVGILGRAIRNLGSVAGSMVASPFGLQAQGAGVGHNLGAALSRWLGAGDYSVASNSLVQKASTGVPMMHKTDQRIVVRHKEFLCEVRSAQNFTIQRAFDLNPGMPGTFPWLSKVASNYQTYSIKGMVFHYVPTSGSAIASTNNALGSVMLQTSYRSNDTPPANKIELLNEYWSCEAVPSESFCHPIECNPKENPFQVQYIRGAPVPTGDNQLLYDLGETYLAVSGQQADGVVLGDLWVTYEIELSKPVIGSNVTADELLSGYTSQENPDIAGSAYIGTHTLAVGSFPVPVTTSGRTITLPIGIYGTFTLVLTFNSSLGCNGLQVNGSPTYTNCTEVNAFRAPVGLVRADINGGTITAGGCLTYVVSFRKTNPEVVATVLCPASTITSGTINRSCLFLVGSSDL